METPTKKEMSDFNKYLKSIKLQIALLFPERDIEDKKRIKDEKTKN